MALHLALWLKCSKCLADTKLSSMELSWCPRRQVLRWKYSLDQSCTFKGPNNIHLGRSKIIKACEARMDPIEDIAEKKISPPRSGWAAIHTGKNIGLEITISCLGDGSYIGDHKFIWPKSQLQPKFQGWARVSKVLKVVANFKSKFDNLAQQYLAHKAAQKLARQLVDNRFADNRWRCQNQTYLDNSHLTLTTNHERKKNLMWYSKLS